MPFILLSLLVPALFVAAVLTAPAYGRPEEDPYYQAMKNIKLFGQIYQEVNDRYVEEVDPEKFIRAGIDGMLDRLDPYSAYLEPEGRDELEIMTKGKYYGVGMRIVLRNGFATCAEQPFPGSPAFRAGIREGDQIIEIDGQSTKGLRLSATAARLRGDKKGSEVAIKIHRPGISEPLSFVLIRDEIVPTDIQYSGWVTPGIGLIKLTRFNRGADKQIAEAVQKLIDQGLQGLILDLRGNPGGLLDQAVAVADLFVAKNELIVYTEGRGEYKRQEFRAQKDPLLGQTPLIVLVDGYSASASEIVAGAIQDLDRGVILGAPSFGKGLVQTVIPLDRRGEQQLKLTTAQYFMPSGRGIQKPEVFEHGPLSVFSKDRNDAAIATEEDEEDSDEEPAPAAKDTSKARSKTTVYYTKNKRQVLGGGGIKPDVEVKNPEYTRYELELFRRSIFFNFSLDYVAAHPDLKKDFKVDESVWAEFEAFLRDKKFSYHPDGWDQLNRLESTARERGYLEQMQKSLDAVKAEFDLVRAAEKEKSRARVETYIQSEIMAKVFGRDAYNEALFAGDEPLQAAVRLLRNTDEYYRILNIKAVAKN
ncbi:MAG: Carboxy-terminal processing protease CtpB precursor [bacterium ADurb.Bin478]|nr:MAG: Carboxy-terminal processing protease CtpB precursor [bacterium ADurb.Bin478]